MTPAQATQMVSNSYPGAGQFYHEVSDGQVDLAGSQAFGWYVLPRPRSAYVTDATGSDPGHLDFGGLTTDCLAAASADFSLPDYWGFAIQVNGLLTAGGFGGHWVVVT